MEVMIHCPESKEAQNELKKTISRIHADLIGSLVNSLPISTEQKCTLIKSVLEEYHKKTDVP